MSATSRVLSGRDNTSGVALNLVLLVGLIVAVLAGSVVTVTLRSSDNALDVNEAGSLAPLLAAHRAVDIERAIIPRNRFFLTTRNLREYWDFAVEAGGPFEEVSRTLTVDEDRHQAELELLRFRDGIGALTARRSQQGIVAIDLVVGTQPNPVLARTASDYALDVAAGRTSMVHAAFGRRMATELPAGLFATKVAIAMAGMQRPARVAAQVFYPSRYGREVVTYLVFRNGLRSVELALDKQGRITNLFLYSL